MKLKTLELQGFRSFYEKQRFDWPQEPGFYFLTGENKAEPKLEANGAGKSTLYEGVLWVLFGKTSRGLKAGELKSWYGSKSCEGVLVFESNGVEYKVCRTWSPNTLKMAVDAGGLKTVEQSDIEDVLKLNFESFLYSIFFGQFRESFLDLLPSKKSEIMASILDLDTWAVRSDRAKSKYNELEGWFHDTKNIISKLEGRLETLKEEDYSGLIKEWEEEQEVKTVRLKKIAKDARKELELIKQEGSQLVDKKKKLESELKEVAEGLDEALAIRQELSEDFRELERDLNKNARDTSPIEREKEKFSSVEDSCPFCKQKISKAYIKKVLDDLHSQLKRMRQEETQILSKKDELKGTLLEVEELVNQILKDQSEINEELSSINLEIAGLKGNSTALTRDLNNAIAELKRADEKENPFIAKQRDTEASIKEIEKQIEEDEASLASLQEKIEAAKYWVKGFKEVRLMLISETLGQLELEVNNYLFQLGLEDWRIEFAVDKETKRGTIKKGFTVMINSPNNPTEEAVPWTSWSGGETQRLKLAGILGLSNLILSRNGIDSFIEIFDEPSQHLSESGVEDLLETLGARSREINKQIWLIDHKNINTSRFDGITTVIKEKEKGSRIVNSL